MKATLLVIATTLSFYCFSQDTAAFKKECKLSAGVSYANTFSGGKGGTSSSFQLGYQLSKNFSIAMEFDEMGFKTKGFVPHLVPDTRFLDLVYSGIVKYHFDTKGKIKFAAGSGWSFLVREVDYYEYTTTEQGSDVHFKSNISSDYIIPVVAEAEYPITKKFALLLRARYYFVPNDTQSFNVGVAASITL